MVRATASPTPSPPYTTTLFRAPGKTPSDHHRCRDFRSRCHGGSRKQMDGAVLSVDGNALALGMLVREYVVPKVT